MPAKRVNIPQKIALDELLATEVNEVAAAVNQHADALDNLAFVPIAANQYGTHPAFATRTALDAWLLGRLAGLVTSTPDAPIVTFDSASRMLSAASPLGSAEIEFSHAGDAYQAYQAFVVDNLAHAVGEWVFRTRAQAGRAASAPTNSPKIEAKTTGAVITSFAPTSGVVGSTMVITGTGFTGATVVSINSGAVASFVVDSATQITATLTSSQASGKVRVTTPGGTATSSGDFTVTAGSAKPKRVVPIGDSLVNNVLTTVSLLRSRFQGTALTVAQAISHPGESTKDYLNSHLSETAAALNSTYDDYALVSLNTNDANQDYVDTVKANNLAFINALLQQGYKGVIWMDVAGCLSPYAYARDANGNIIGTTTAEQQAGFDSTRKGLNANLRTLVGTGKLLAAGDLSVYNNVYLQANAADARYFYPARTGPYGGNEPGWVHFTNDYGAPYWAEAAAQAIYRGLGIAPKPATITIPDAPNAGGGGPAPQKFLLPDANVTLDSSGYRATANDGITNFNGQLRASQALAGEGTDRFNLITPGSGACLGIITAALDNKTIGGDARRKLMPLYYYADEVGTQNLFSYDQVIKPGTNDSSVENPAFDFTTSQDPSNPNNWLLRAAANGVDSGKTVSIAKGSVYLLGCLSANAVVEATHISGAQVANPQ